MLRKSHFFTYIVIVACGVAIWFCGFTQGELDRHREKFGHYQQGYHSGYYKAQIRFNREVRQIEASYRKEAEESSVDFDPAASPNGRLAQN